MVGPIFPFGTVVPRCFPVKFPHCWLSFFQHSFHFGLAHTDSHITHLDPLPAQKSVHQSTLWPLNAPKFSQRPFFSNNNLANRNTWPPDLNPNSKSTPRTRIFLLTLFRTAKRKTVVVLLLFLLQNFPPTLSRKGHSSPPRNPPESTTAHRVPNPRPELGDILISSEESLFFRRGEAPQFFFFSAVFSRTLRENYTFHTLFLTRATNDERLYGWLVG